MLFEPNSVPTEPEPSADDDVQADRDVLQGMIDTGVSMQHMIHAAAQAAFVADAAPGGKPGTCAKPLRELATGFERIARAVRHTILLKQSLSETRRAARAKRAAARKQIRRAVEARIHAAGLKPEQAERLRAELVERVERVDLDEQLDHVPIEKIIADIRKDLGLDPIPGTPALRPVTTVARESAAHPATTATRLNGQSPAHPAQAAAHPILPRQLE